MSLDVFINPSVPSGLVTAKQGMVRILNAAGDGGRVVVRQGTFRCVFSGSTMVTACTGLSSPCNVTSKYKVNSGTLNGTFDVSAFTPGFCQNLSAPGPALTIGTSFLPDASCGTTANVTPGITIDMMGSLDPQSAVIRVKVRAGNFWLFDGLVLPCDFQEGATIANLITGPGCYSDAGSASGPVLAYGGSLVMAYLCP